MNQHVQTQVNKQDNTYYNVLHITKKQLGDVSKLLVCISNIWTCRKPSTNTQSWPVLMTKNYYKYIKHSKHYS